VALLDPNAGDVSGRSLAPAPGAIVRAVATDERATFDALLADLAAEEAELDAIVVGLGHDGWATPTPARGFDVRDSIAHLAIGEELAGVAASDPAAFAARLDELVTALLSDPDALEARLLARGRAHSGAAVLEWWRRERTGTLARLTAHEPRDRIPWITGLMGARSFATARLMETWAHGQDVVDGLGVDRTPSVRLRHVADLGVRTRAHAFTNRGLEVPAGDVAVELAAPDGTMWRWGSSDTDVVRGSALDFCLVVAQRRHPDDTDLVVRGTPATEWIAIAQAFAGPATNQRPPTGL